MFCCVWEMSGDRDWLLYWPKFFYWPLQHFFRILASGCSTKESLSDAALSLQAGSLSFLFQLATAAGTLSIFFFNAHRLLLFFGLFTQVHLLIDGSIEGQYITIILSLFFKMYTWGHFPHVPLHPPHTHASYK